MNFFPIALSNLIRHRQRTTSTILSSAFGIAMMVFTNGFNDGFSKQWVDYLIDQTEGHLVVRHYDFLRYGTADLEKIYIENPEPLITKILENEHVVDVMPRVLIGGIIGQDTSSNTFFGWADGLEKIDTVLPKHSRKVVSGNPLSKDDPNGVVLGKGLAKSLGAEVGDELVILSNSIYGDMSSTLVHIRGLLEDDIADIESNFMWGGLSPEVRQDLLDIEGGATTLVVRIKNMQHVAAVVDSLNAYFIKTKQPWTAVPWYANEDFQSVTAMFSAIGNVIMFILSFVVGFILSNAMMVSIYDRIREIGTMRAIGFKKHQLFQIFYCEFFLLMLVGCSAGFLIGAVSIAITHATGIPLLEGLVDDVRPILTINNLIISFTIPCFFSALAVFFPIRSVNKLTITETLK